MEFGPNRPHHAIIVLGSLVGMISVKCDEPVRPNDHCPIRGQRMHACARLRIAYPVVFTVLTHCVSPILITPYFLAYVSPYVAERPSDAPRRWNFAKSLKISQGYLKLHRWVQGACKFLLVFHCNTVSILHCFWDIQRQIIGWSWNNLGQGSLRVIENGTV